MPIAGVIRSERVDRTAEVSRSVKSLVNDLSSQLLFPGLHRDVEPVLTQTHIQEEGFHARPSIKILIPDHIKAILVDDWENVTKNCQLVPLPAAHPVNSILNDYIEFEKPKRMEGSAAADILEEVVAGLKEYFDKCLGRILLYRYEVEKIITRAI